jgi:hypothetical protein
MYDYNYMLVMNSIIFDETSVGTPSGTCSMHLGTRYCNHIGYYDWIQLIPTGNFWSLETTFMGELKPSRTYPQLEDNVGLPTEETSSLKVL